MSQRDEKRMFFTYEQIILLVFILCIVAAWLHNNGSYYCAGYRIRIRLHLVAQWLISLLILLHAMGMLLHFYTGLQNSHFQCRSVYK